MVEPRLTPQTMKVIEALMERPGASGADICRATRLPSGTVYPILLRLENAGWLGSAWESGDPTKLGRPRRRFYHLSGEGAQAVRQAVRQAASLFSGLALS